MQQRIGKKIIIYFLLFILIGSVNNNALNDLNFKNNLKINIYGLNENETSNIAKELNKLNLNNIFFIEKNQISKIINSNNLIENFYIFKKYPFTLDIRIDETTLLAKINNNGKIYLVGSNGKLINDNYAFSHLPFIFGKPDIKEFLKLKKKIDKSKYSYEEIKNLFYYPSKRWDLELKNDIIIKLSKSNILKSINQSYDFLHDINGRDVKIIDTRIKNQIIVK